VKLLCFPRVLGYVFNPLSIYFCHDPAGSLRAILYEVSNTFGQRHSYLLPVADGRAGPVRQHCRKEFYVSPFIAMDCRYDFRIEPPEALVSVVIRQSDGEGPMLTAAFAGERRPLDDSALARAFLAYPLMTLKVIAGIHWEALKLWRKGLPILERPAPPREAVTIGRQGE
jgi:hypothetical protein